MSELDLEFHYTVLETDETTEEWHRYVVDCPGEGPLDLASICDLCASAKVKAVLHDEAGFIKGHVDAKGDYRLT
jgi:hypothetical protein